MPLCFSWIDALYIYKYTILIWRFPSSHGGTPSYHPFHQPTSCRSSHFGTVEDTNLHCWRKNTHTITHTYYIHFKYHIIIARFTTKNCSKDQIEQNIAISMHFTKIAQLFESSAPQLFTMLSCDSQILGTTLAVNSTFFPQTVYS